MFQNLRRTISMSEAARAAGPAVRDITGAYELVGNFGLPTPYGYGAAAPRGLPAWGHGLPAWGQQGQRWAVAPGLAMPQQVGYSQQYGVAQRAPSTVRRHYLPMASVGAVNANTSAVAQTQPQALAFRPDRIIVPASIAPDFTIDAIYCGIKPQFVAAGSIPAETFTQDAVGVDLHMDTVNTSQNFTLNVTNQSGASRQFRATVLGITADD